MLPSWAVRWSGMLVCEPASFLMLSALFMLLVNSAFACAALRALGLNKLNATKEVEATPQILGMVKKVSHLVKVEEV